jgi:CubicO group peptidase (beta-lactamase class C family)
MARKRMRAMAVLWGAALAVAALPAVARAQATPCATPVDVGDEWTVADIGRSGLDAGALCSLLGTVAQGTTNIHGVVIERHGRLAAELYRRGKDRSIYGLFARDVAFGPTQLHDMRSVSKSIVALLVGIAMAEGKLPGVSTPVLDLYPEFAELKAAGREGVTVEHLLAMSSGLEWNETVTSYGSLSNDETHLYWHWAPSRLVLGRPLVAPPGTRFNYNGGGTVVLADLLVRATKRPFKDLVRETLFDPLGIRDWEWVGDLYGRPLVFAGLRMRPRDLLKVGRMLLDRGEWQGRRVVPAEWVARSLDTKIATGDALGYAYHWWTGSADRKDGKVSWSAAFGNGGQRLFVVRELDMAVVVTAGAYNDPSIGRAVNQLFRDIVATVRD